MEVEGVVLDLSLLVLLMEHKDSHRGAASWDSCGDGLTTHQFGVNHSLISHSFDTTNHASVRPSASPGGLLGMDLWAQLEVGPGCAQRLDDTVACEGRSWVSWDTAVGGVKECNVQALDLICCGARWRISWSGVRTWDRREGDGTWRWRRRTLFLFGGGQ